MSEDRSNENPPQRGKRTREHYQRIGAIGGKLIKERYGDAYYATIGKRAGPPPKPSMGERTTSKWADGAAGPEAVRTKKGG